MHYHVKKSYRLRRSINEQVKKVTVLRNVTIMYQNSKVLKKYAVKACGKRERQDLQST